MTLNDDTHRSWLRLENEHLNNTSGYRRVDAVPMHFETETKDVRRDARGDRVSPYKIIVEVLLAVGAVAAVSLFAVLSSRSS
jgi:hypothetical protein